MGNLITLKRFFFLAILLILVSSCGNSTDSENQQSKGNTVVDLSDGGAYYGLNLLMDVPDTTGKNNSIIMNEGMYGGIRLNCGKNFDLEVGLYDGNLKLKKEELESDKIFKVSYILEDSYGFVYKKHVDNTNIEQYHFFVNKTIDGVSYFIENSKDEDFTKEQVELMFEYAQTLRMKSQS
jgi:hypothetical protein